MSMLTYADVYADVTPFSSDVYKMKLAEEERRLEREFVDIVADLCTDT
jgi:hypothetical protein